MKIQWAKEKCYACGTCQLICSYHHTGSFWPDCASIKVLRNPQNGSIKWKLDSTCDQCDGEPEALCAKYCVYSALIVAADQPSEIKETTDA
jgi:Fe-S-cluster-containing hydrogenase component 2